MANYKSVDDSQIVLALRDIKKGMFVSDVAVKYGYATTTVAVWCRNAQIKYAKKPHGKRHNWDWIKARV